MRGIRLNGGYGEADVNAMDTFGVGFHGLRCEGSGWKGARIADGVNPGQRQPSLCRASAGTLERMMDSGSSSPILSPYHITSFSINICEVYRLVWLFNACKRHISSPAFKFKVNPFMAGLL